MLDIHTLSADLFRHPVSFKYHRTKKTARFSLFMYCCTFCCGGTGCCTSRWTARTYTDLCIASCMYTAKILAPCFQTGPGQPPGPWCHGVGRRLASGVSPGRAPAGCGRTRPADHGDIPGRSRLLLPETKRNNYL